jgi:hypothetical protein
MRGNIRQVLIEITAVSYWVKTKCVATTHLRGKNDYQAVHACFAEVIGTANCSYT